ncbi:hypothetical protein GTV15_01805 [Streptomyces sp. SID7803]|nr:hypothetical protein [Streptomyces sp. SID7803]
MQTILAVPGSSLNPDALERAVQTVLDRHDALRAAFVQPPGGPWVQVIPEKVRVPWRVRTAADQAEVAALAAAERREGFDPAEPPPLARFLLVQLSDDDHAASEQSAEHRLVVTNHHILLDGWSLPLLLREIFAACRPVADDRSDGDALPAVTPYQAYASWLAQQDVQAAERTWQAALSGGVDSCRVVPGAGRTAGARRELHRRLPERVTARLRETGRSLGVTTSTMVHAAWGLVLGRLTGRWDVVFGSVVSGRPPPAVPGIESMIGCFINTVPVRLRPRPGGRASRSCCGVSRPNKRPWARHITSRSPPCTDWPVSVNCSTPWWPSRTIRSTGGKPYGPERARRPYGWSRPGTGCTIRWAWWPPPLPTGSGCG